MVETSFVCHGRTEPVRPLATFSPTALGSWAQSRDGFCKCLQCCRLSVFSSPFWGGNRLQSLAVVYADRNRLPGICCTIQCEQQSCGSLFIDKSSMLAAFVPHIKSAYNDGLPLLLSGKPAWAIRYNSVHRRN